LYLQFLYNILCYFY